MTGIERLREVRERLLAKPELFPIAIGRLEGEALRSWVRRERARRTLEVGLGWGVGTLFICEGLLEQGADARHVACDPFQLASPKFEGEAVRALEEAGVRDLVEVYPEESQIVLPRLLAQGRRFDFAFIDANHRFEAVFLDLVYCGRLLQERGVVFVDDTDLPAIRSALGLCVANLGWAIEDEGEGDDHQWAVARTGPADAFHRPYDEFVPL